MNVEDVKELSVLDRFLYWIRERHKIYLKRQQGLPRPWTDDVILQSYFFTNVYRENDKVTVWLRERIRGPLADDPRVLFATIAFRWFNYIPTGALLLGSGLGNSTDLFTNWNLDEAIRRLKLVNGQVFTGAFNISNSGSTKPKVNRVCEDYIQPAWIACTQCLLNYIPIALSDNKLTLSDMHDTLGDLPGLGGSGFMAAQVVCDLKYTYILRNAPDWLSWSSIGPGSRKGMNLLCKYPEGENYTKKSWDGCMRWLRTITAKKIEKYGMPPLHAQDLQSCLCEFFKYSRALDGGGSKRRYAGA